MIGDYINFIGDFIKMKQAILLQAIEFLI